MSFSETTNVAAFFDFDGIWYNPQQIWQIKHIHAGILGSSISWKDAYKYCNKLKNKQQNICLTDYYKIPQTKWHVVSFEESNNVTPPEALWEIAHRHKLRNNDLYILSHLNSQELMSYTNIPMPHKKNELLQHNPFDEATFLYASPSEGEEININIDFCIDYSLKNKLHWILSFLRSKANAKHTFTVPNHKKVNKVYDQIFVYYTQSEYKNTLTSILNMYQESFSTNRMALIPSYIAEVR